jgi:hypothetical protein
MHNQTGRYDNKQTKYTNEHLPMLAYERTPHNSHYTLVWRYIYQYRELTVGGGITGGC